MKHIELAGAVIINEENAILLMHRNTSNLKQWELPGGKLEAEEKPEQAAVRELKEELNLNIKIKKYLGCKEFIYNNCILKYNWYLCELDKEIPKIMEEKFDKIKYFSKKDLYQNIDKLSTNMKYLIEEIDITKL